MNLYLFLIVWLISVEVFAGGPNAGAWVYLDGNVGNEQNDRQSSITLLMNSATGFGVEVFIDPFTGSTIGGEVVLDPGIASVSRAYVDNLWVTGRDANTVSISNVFDDFGPPLPPITLNQDGHFATILFSIDTIVSEPFSVGLERLVLRSHVIDNEFAVDTLYAVSSLRVNPSSASLRVDFDPSPGNQNLETKDVDSDTMTLQLFAESFPEVTGYGFTFQAKYSLDYHNFEAGDFISDAQAVSRQSRDGGEIGVASFTGARASGNGFLGGLSFHVDENFYNSAEIIITEFGFSYPDGTFNSAPIHVKATLIEPRGSADFNYDGVVNFTDFLLFAEAFGMADPPHRFDLTGDYHVGFADFLLFAQAFA